MNRFKSIREKLQITQAALAGQLGCTPGNINHYEKRGQTVPPDMAKRLIVVCRNLGHEVTYLDIYGPADADGVDTSSEAQGVANA